MAETSKWERLVRPMQVDQVQSLLDRAHKELSHPAPGPDWAHILTACRRELDLRHHAEAMR